jgi:CDP-ribitol ribitolphosphotransferase
LIAKADYIFVDDYVPIFKTITPRKETKLIQLWHAGVGFKSVGYSRFGRDGSPHPTDSCHRRYDYALCGAEGLIHVYEEVFGIQENQFLPYGLPRLDGYMDEAKIQAYRESFYTQYPQFKDKKIVMFAPTYRGATQDKAYYPFDKINFDTLYETLGDEYIFMFKMHPFIQEKVEIPAMYQDKIVDFSQGHDINELFYVTEVLITDFSSNLYEFALHRKPMIFYAFDKDYYQLTRGVHRTLDEAPGNVCESFDEVLNVLKHHTFDLEKLDAFIKDSFPAEAGNASDRLIDEVILGRGK